MGPRTPEGEVKKRVTSILRTVDDIYMFMPVPSGYGESTVDYIGTVKVTVTPEMVGQTIGVFFGIETKAPGKKPTDRQQTIIERIEKGGGKVFVISGDMSELKAWLVETGCV